MDDPMIPVPRFASLLGIQVAWDASEANFDICDIYDLWDILVENQKHQQKNNK